MIIPVLRASECRVWWADHRDYEIPGMTTVLSDTELTRAARFHRDADRRRFITGTWLLRTIVAAQLGTTAAAVEIDRTCDECGKPHGKPRFGDGGTSLEASISHSGNRVAVALSTAGPVGVDVEEVIPDAGGIPQLALSPMELKSLQTLSEDEQEVGFIQMWVRKEAALKATGYGLRIPPDQVEVSGPYEDPALLSWPLDISPGTVQMQTLAPGGGYAAAVAILTAGRLAKVSETEATSLHQNDFPALVAIAA